MQSSKKYSKESTLGFIYKTLDNNPRHCKGIKALLPLPTYGVTLTGGKDGIVKQWDSRQLNAGQSSELYLAANFYDHIDWVNRLCYAQNHQKLISCSNDSSIRIWDLKKLSNQEEESVPGMIRSIEVFNYHKDYVQAMDYVKYNSTLISQGFEGCLLMLDLEMWKTLILEKPRAHVLKNIVEQKHEVPNSSYTSISASAGGNIICVAQQVETLTAIDRRDDNLTVRKMEGHKDSIREVLVSRSGKMCLSASSDHTIKLWDIAYRQCLRTISCHTDSVFTFAVNSNYTTIYSGGKDGRIFSTLLTDEEQPSKLLYEGQSAIVRVALDQENQILWAAQQDGDWFSISLKKNIEEEQIELFRMNSTVPIKNLQVLKNRQFLVLQRQKNEAQIWDIPRGQRVEHLKRENKINISRLADYLDVQFPCKTQSWFTASYATGDLMIELNNYDYKQGAGMLFEYKRDKLKFDQETKVTITESQPSPVNLGDVFLRKYLSAWMKYQLHQDVKSLKELLGPLFSSQKFHKRISDKYPLLMDMPTDVPQNVLIFQKEWKSLAAQKMSSLKQVSNVPEWVQEAIYQSQLSSSPDQMVVIKVAPQNELELPNMPQQKRKITANAIATVQLLVTHIAKNIKLWNYVDATEEQIHQGSQKYLETTLKGEIIDNKATFHMLEKFVEKGDSLSIQYRKKKSIQKSENLIEI